VTGYLVVMANPGSKAPAAEKSPAVELEVGDRLMRISNPDRVYFPARGETKLDLARYYLSVGDGIFRALRERPCMMHRFPEGVSGEKVHQKRLPSGAPPWLETVRVSFPRYNRHADELCVTELASVIWAVQMSTIEFHPWNSRCSDTERPDEWRIDLDPMPECGFDTVRRVADVAHEVLDGRSCRRTAPSRPCLVGTPSWVTCMPESMTRCSRWTVCWTGPIATIATIAMLAMLATLATRATRVITATRLPATHPERRRREHFEGVRTRLRCQSIVSAPFFSSWISWPSK
jgi:hypothetical protein